METENKTEEVVNDTDFKINELKGVIDSLNLKIEDQLKIIKENNDRFVSFVENYMNKKHDEIKTESDKIVEEIKQPKRKFVF